MSKPLRQKIILELLEERSVGSQEDLQRALSKRGFKVGQATLSRDIHDLGLVKTGTGYMLPGEAVSEPALPFPSVGAPMANDWTAVWST